MKRLLIIILVATTATFSSAQTNDFCVNADIIDSLLISQPGDITYSKVYNNDNAGLDSTIFEAGGFDCFAEPLFDTTVPIIESTMWFKFTGTGDIFLIETENCNNSANFIDFGDTQAVLYTGGCGDLTPIACSEDGFDATEDNLKFGIQVNTEVGVEYMLVIDGFNYLGDLSLGDFCLAFTHIQKTYCADANAGTLADEADSLYCADEVVIVPYNLTDVVIPNSEEGKKGIVWFARIGNSYTEMSYETILADDEIFQISPFTDRLRPRGVSFTNDASVFDQDTFWTFFPVVIAGVTADTPSLDFFDYELGDGCVIAGDLVKLYISSDVNCDVMSSVNDTGVKDFNFKGSVYDYNANLLGHSQSKEEFVRDFQLKYEKPLIICDENGNCQSYYLIR